MNRIFDHDPLKNGLFYKFIPIFFFVCFSIAYGHGQCVDMSSILVAYECTDGVEGNPTAGTVYRIRFNLPSDGSTDNYCFTYTDDITNTTVNTFVVMDPIEGAEVLLGHFLNGTSPDITIKKVSFDCNETGESCLISTYFPMEVFHCPLSRSGCESGSGNVNNYRPTPTLYIDFTDNPSGLLQVDRDQNGLERGGDCCNDGTRCLEIQIIPDEETIGFNIQAYAAGAVEFYIELWNDADDCDNGSSAPCSCEFGCVYDLIDTNDPTGSGNYSCTLDGGSENNLVPFCAPPNNQAFSIILCKPGDDNTGFYIESLPSPMVDSIRLDQPCDDSIQTYGFNPDINPVWTSINESPIEYLSSTQGHQVHFEYTGDDLNELTTFEYQVCGFLSNTVTACTGVNTEVCLIAEVKVYPPILISLNQDKKCPEGRVEINSQVQGGSGNYRLSWYKDGQLIPGQTGSNITVDEEGEYSLYVVDENLESSCNPNIEIATVFVGDVFCCNADVGDILVSADYPSSEGICLGEDLGPFMNSYSALDENVPTPILNFDFAFVLVNQTGQIVGTSTSGDFDLSTLTPSVYSIYGVSYSNNNDPISILDYVDSKVNISEIINDRDSGEVCLDVSNEDPNGNEVMITIYDDPFIEMNIDDSYCINEGVIQVSTNVVGGSFNSTILGLTDNGNGSASINISDNVPGIYTIHFEYADANTCSNATSQSFEILDIPDVSIMEIQDVCANNSTVEITGVPSNSDGFFTSTAATGFTDNMDGTASLDLSANTLESITVWYTYSDGNCSNTAARSFNIIQPSSVEFNLPSSVCDNEGILPISGTPANLSSTFSTSIPNVLNDLGLGMAELDLNNASPGDIEITYSFEDENGCLVSLSKVIEVLESASVSMDDIQDLCPNAGTQSVSANPTQPAGYFLSVSGLNFTDNGNGTADFDPLDYAGESHSLTYHYIGNNGCRDSSKTEFQIFEGRELSILNVENVCPESNDFIISGSPNEPPGYFVSDGAILVDNNNGTATVDISELSEGVNEIKYVYQDDNGCVFETSENIILFSNQSLTINNPENRCINEGLVLIQASPIGGSFSSNSSGLIDNGDGTATLDPNLAGAGVHSVIYSFNNLNNCVSEISTEVELYNLPTIQLDDYMVCKDADVEISPILTPGDHSDLFYQWSILSSGSTGATLSNFTNPNALSTIFNASGLFDGSLQVKLDVTDGNSCMFSAFATITINVNPMANVMDMIYCKGSIIDVDGNPEMGSSDIVSHEWILDPVNTSTSTGFNLNQVNEQVLEIDAANANSGEIFLLYMASDINGCNITRPVKITLVEPPNAGIDGALEICNAEIPAQLTLINGLSGSPDGNGNWIDLDDSGVNLNQLGVNFANTPEGRYKYSYVVEGQANCPDDEAIVEVQVDNCFDLALTKKISSTAPFFPGDMLSYEIEIFNQGDVDAYDVIVEDFHVQGGFNFNTINNTSAFTGNDHDWWLQQDRSYTEIDHIPANGSKKVYLNLRVPTGFQNVEIKNTSVIARFSNENDSEYIPFDEDNLDTMEGSNEVDNEIQDDANGGTDMIADNDVFDFELISICLIQANNATFVECETVPFSNTSQFDLFNVALLNQIDDNGDGDGDSSDGDAGYEVVSYHFSESDAQSNLNPISSPFNTNSISVFARLEDGLCFATSRVELVVAEEPQIVLQPQDQQVCYGDDVTMEVIANGTNLSYQWQVDDGSGYVNIANSNTAALHISEVLSSMDGNKYRVVISSLSNNNISCFDVLSQEMILSVYQEEILACNNLIHVSLDDNCHAYITTDILLEDDVSQNIYDIEIWDNNGDVVSNPVNGNYLNQTLQFKISNRCDMNSCWGLLLIEDKFAPTISCPNDLTLSCNVAYQPVLPTIDDNCSSDISIQLISDETIDISCEDPINPSFSAKRILMYQATDEQGNLSEICTQEIYFIRKTLSDIQLPQDVNLPCYASGFSVGNPSWDENLNDYPDPDEGSGVLEIGSPTIDGHPILENIGFCEINANYEDLRIDICANSFKVIRTWTILDWCSGDILTHDQIIKIMDNEPPVSTCPSDFFIEYADPISCLASHTVEDPIVLYECGSWDYTVDYLIGGEEACNETPPNGPFITTNVVQLNDGSYQIQNLPIGCTWIRYTITDECGNVSSDCRREIQVLDNSAPIAVCHENTVVSLNHNGQAEVYAASFDDGSHDACGGSLELHVRRMTVGCNSTSQWSDKVAFCCKDIGNETLVELRVTDASGNWNTCMVNVVVQDKIAPEIECPEDMTLMCGALIDPSYTGFPMNMDNCSVQNVSYTDFGMLNTCGQGQISREWTIVDHNGVENNCTQRILILEDNPFGSNSIVWPQDASFSGCLELDINPENPLLGSPQYGDSPCSLVAHTYEDQIFNFADDACFKILRTWTVIDWCQYDPSNPLNNGYWSHVQVIKLNNSEAPVFGNCSAIEYCVYGDNCSGSIDLFGVASDDCTSAELLTWHFQIKLENESQFGPIQIGNNASGIYPVGNHEIRWFVEDQCGNNAECIQELVVRDCKNPTPYCIGEISTVLMDVNGEIQIWASDFDLGSFDNCFGDLQFSFSSSTNHTSETFNCDNLGLNNIEIWVTDNHGNQSFCNVLVDIQENGGCDGGNETLDISGSVYTIDNTPIENVRITLSETGSLAESLNTYSDFQGEYSIGGGVSMKNYSLKARFIDDYMNGVSTLDLVLIQKHILQTQLFDSPYQYLAADINQSHTISAIDLIELRKLILGLYSELPNNFSWRFPIAESNFVNPSNPFPFQEEYNFDPLENDTYDLDFIGVKIGDVNGSAQIFLNEDNVDNRSYNDLIFNYSDSEFATGEIVNVPLVAKDAFPIAGMQFTIDFDQDVLDFVGIESELINVNESNYGNYLLNTGLIPFSWNVSDHIVFDGSIMSLKFKAKGTGTLSNSLELNSNVINSEAYNDRLEVMNIRLESNSIQKDDDLFELFQNRPNPFSEETVIYFNLPHESSVLFEVYDLQGRVVKTIDENFKKGRHQILLNKEELGVKGMLFYSMRFDQFEITKKMMVL